MFLLILKLSKSLGYEPVGEKDVVTVWQGKKKKVGCVCVCVCLSVYVWAHTNIHTHRTNVINIGEMATMER